MSAKKRRQLGRKLLLSLASVVLGCGLCELIVRFAIGEQPKFPRRVVEGPHGLRINEPDAVYRHQSADVSVWFRINSRGLRADREIPYEKPAGTRRVVALGDSFTVGYEVDVEDCFCRVVERELAARGRDVEVLNAGVSGFSTAEETLYLERELIRYAPDVVLISFYGNDLADNVRSDLFALAGGALQPKKERYVPLGTIGNFLNTNPVFNLLSERSDAFALFKESATRLMKGKMVQENLAAVDAAAPAKASSATSDAPGDAAPAGPAGTELDEAGRARAEYATALTVAIYERLYAFCRDHGIELVIQSIPSKRQEPFELVDLFPRSRFALDRPGLTYVSGKELLNPHKEKELLYWTRSTGHWTPFAHRVCGRVLAERIDGLLAR